MSSWERTKKAGLSSAEVAMLTGASYRQLDYAVRAGFIELRYDAEGSGYPRMWMPNEVALMFAYVRIQQAGLKGDRVREVMEMLSTQPWKKYLLFFNHMTMLEDSIAMLDTDAYEWMVVIPLKREEWMKAGQGRA